MAGSSQDIKKPNEQDFMSKEDYNALKAAGDAYNNAKTEAERQAAHDQAEAIRGKYNYSGGTDGSEYRPGGNPISSGPQAGSGKSGGSSGSGSSGSANSSGGYTPADNSGYDYDKNIMTEEDYADLKAAGEAYNNAKTEDERKAAHDRAEAIRKKYNYSGGEDGSEYKPLTNYTDDVPDFSGLLNSWLEQAKKQQEAGIDYATNQAIEELERAKEDAEKKFQTQQNQTDENEAKALDNQALYAEARGDRGGIGQAQYGQIQATAMENRRAINSARTQLATDTARQIADLRAQGEFKKADALLQLTQTYLGQLIDLQKWGAEYSLSKAQFDAQLQQWQKEFELSVGSLVGEYQGKPTWAASQAERELQIEMGMAALSSGVRPSPSQQQAMGYTDEQIDAILAEYKLSQTLRSSGGSGSGGSSSGGGSDSGSNSEAFSGNTYQEMYVAGLRSEAEAYEYLTQVKGLSSTEAAKLAEYFDMQLDDLETWYQGLQQQQEWETATIDREDARKQFGPVSDGWLAEQVANGYLTMYLESGRIKFAPTGKTDSWLPQAPKLPGL